MSNSIATSHQVFEDDSPKYVLKKDKVKPQNTEMNLISKLKSIISVSELLRLFGACAVLASMSLFLLNGWAEGNDIQRYLKLLAQTGLLTFAGFAMSYTLKENKGARLFFALALVSVVANFTILGALTYSMFQLDGGLIDYPSMVTWTVVSASSFWPVFIGAVIVLMLLARFSFSIFARNIAGSLSISFLAMNTLLLIPVRTSFLVSIIAVLGLLVASVIVKKISATENVVFTKETKFAMSLLFVPALLIIARAISLYHVDEVLLVLLSGLAYSISRFVVQRQNEESLLGSLIKVIQFCSALAFAISVSSLLPASFNTLTSFVFSIIVLGLSIDQINISRKVAWKKSILNITTTILIVLNLLVGLVTFDFIIQLSSLMISIALFYVANRFATQEHASIFCKRLSFIGIVASIGILILHVVDLINLGNWMLIGISGVSLIVLGSLYERFGLSLTPIDTMELDKN